MEQLRHRGSARYAGADLNFPKLPQSFQGSASLIVPSPATGRCSTNNRLILSAILDSAGPDCVCRIAAIVIFRAVGSQHSCPDHALRTQTRECYPDMFSADPSRIVSPGWESRFVIAYVGWFHYHQLRNWPYDLAAVENDSMILKFGCIEFSGLDSNEQKMDTEMDSVINNTTISDKCTINPLMDCWSEAF
ncbi:hypothetical protein T07_12751 [Trichinella nelsoni]|uniref:Uncharacterized protein n=1 Tax=Trichinella nelsoni TaxID=6336 RepID=A0A0V0RV58_9BILA|nr:hypothetical protein T07_12751 [Trichinella nelsoni]